MNWLIGGIFIVILFLGQAFIIWVWLNNKHQNEVTTIENTHQQDMQRFVRRFDHELKNPITAIRFALANLTSSTGNPEQHLSIQSIDEQITRISDLLTNLRKLTELNRVTLEYIEVDLHTLLNEIIDLVCEKYPDHNPSFSRDYTANQVLYGDRYLLLLMIYNLIDNAIKFSPPQSKVRLQTVDNPNGTLSLTIQDEGMGIQAIEIEHIWEELYRSHAVQHIPGSGLGLALVKSIAEGHNGSVTISSDGTQGTIVELVLPCHLP